MLERIISILPSNRKNKKYVAKVENLETKKTRKIHFGSTSYQQYKDRTPQEFYKELNHLDKKRRKSYFQRHSGVKTKKEALEKEIRESGGLFNAKILSHKFLW